MNTYFKTIRKPLKWVSFPRGMYFTGLLLEGMMFPLEQVSVGLIQKYLVNAVEYGELRYMKYVYALSVVILATVFVINPLADCLKEWAMQDYSRNLGALAAGKLLDYRFFVYGKYKTGELITRLRDNLGAIPRIYTESIFRLLLGIFYGGGAVAVMLSFNWQLSIAVILLCALESFLLKKGAEKITKKEETLQKLTDKQYQLLVDIVKNLGYIRMASVSNYIRKRYKKTGDESAAKTLEIGRVQVALSLLEDGFEALNLLLIFSLGICLYLAGGIDLGSVVSFLYLQDGITYMISNLREFFSGINTQAVCCDRVEELLNEEQEGMIFCVIPTVKEEIQPGDIRINNLSFQYSTEKEQTFEILNLIIPKGKVTLLPGVSGSGKSTLLKLLLALYPPQTGSIRIGERDYREMDLTEIRSCYAYVEQFPYLFQDTIEANIRCSNTTASLEEVMEAAKMAKAHEFIIQKEAGYQTLIREQGSNFSGGEKQRIAIARAFLKNAPILILDEATSAIDRETEAEICRNIRQLADQGKTVLMVSHRENPQVAPSDIFHNHPPIPHS